MGKKKEIDAYREAIRERVMEAYLHHRKRLEMEDRNEYESAQIGALLALAEEVAELVDAVENGLKGIENVTS